jgi:CARDB
MRRVVITAALLAAAALLAPAAASAAPVGGARLVACQSALDPDARLAVFEGRMRIARGAARMQMRFTLQTRTAGERRWHALRAPGFGRWLTSDTGVGRYVYTKRLLSLLAPASYRTIVRFRWLAGDGRRLGGDRDTSPACRQRDLRADLRPRGVEARAGGDAVRARYVVPVANRGHTAAGPFDVVVSVAGTTLTPVRAPGLAAGESAFVEVEGPPCSQGQMLTVDVDPTGAVDERSEADNRLSVACPGAPW